MLPDGVGGWCGTGRLRWNASEPRWACVERPRWWWNLIVIGRVIESWCLSAGLRCRMLSVYSCIVCRQVRRGSRLDGGLHSSLIQRSERPRAGKERLNDIYPDCAILWYH